MFNSILHLYKLLTPNLSTIPILKFCFCAYHALTYRLPLLPTPALSPPGAPSPCRETSSPSKAAGQALWVQHLGEQLGELLKEVGAVVVTVIVDVELSHKTRNPPQLNNGFQSHLLHFIWHLWVFHGDYFHQFLDVHLAETQGSSV